MPLVQEPAYPLINGNRHDWASIQLELAGLKKTAGMRALNYKHTLEYEHVMAGGSQPVGDTLGTYSAEAGFEMLLVDYQHLIQTLGNGYGAVHFNVLVKYAKKKGDPILVDELRGCRIKGEDRSHSQGNGALVVKVDLGVQLLIVNGVQMVPDMIGV